MANILGALLSLLILGMLVSSAYLWTQAFLRLAAGKSLLSLESRRPVPWGLMDLGAICFAVLLLILGAQLTAQAIFAVPKELVLENAQARDLAVALFSSSLSMLAGCVLAVGILTLRGANALDLGWNSQRLLEDLRLGGIAFLMLAPPMYLLQFVLTRIWPSEHPIQTLLLSDPDVGVILGAAFTAMIVAPLTEEIFFRLILQGWLEKFARLISRLWRGSYDVPPNGTQQLWTDIGAVILGDSSDQPFADPPAESVQVDDETALTQSAETFLSSNESENPYASPQVTMQKPVIEKAPEDSDFTTRATCPIVVSATIFALLHWGHGPDPVPLFFLAVGLGFLYHRTHRILPCIIVHFLVNSLSMTALILFLLSGEEPP